MFEILVTRGAESDPRGLSARDRRSVVDAMERQLIAEADVPTRNREVLSPLQAPWAGLDPVWELRVGEFRVFHDVDAEEMQVVVRAVRRKPPHRTTEEIL